ncbi:HGxxPAAW family protein [Streptomyces sp. NPDC005774]|uniref:HGxxPAAW family protein n=1 Tax=Streptomyces sp. NPDC005774 TaxID=3364728 RepID=UPI0036BC6BB1
MSAHQYDHGHTVAGWTGFGIVTVGAAVLALGVCTGSGVSRAAGLGIVLLGLLVTWALHLAGWGKPTGRRPREQWDWRVRDPEARDGHPGCLGCRLAGRGRTTVAESGAHLPGSVPVPRSGAGEPGPVRAGGSVR